MTKIAIAKVFMTGRSQAVRLPKEFRLPGTEVRITKTSGGLLLTPICLTAEDWAAEMATYGDLTPAESPVDKPIDWADPFEDKRS